MNRFFLQIMAVCLSLSALVSCGGDEPVVIPRSTLSEIYAEMLVTDQWIVSTPSIRLIADTSLVYEPILQKYGYTGDDYRRSVEHYMDDPERFARIFRETADILDMRLSELKRMKGDIEDQERKQKAAEKFRPDFRPEDYFPYLFDEPYVHYYDSIAFEPDSSLMIYRLLPVETSDTLYDRIEMIIRTDTLALKDTLPAEDTLMLKDGLNESFRNIPLRSDEMPLRKIVKKDL